MRVRCLPHRPPYVLERWKLRTPLSRLFDVDLRDNHLLRSIGFEQTVPVWIEADATSVVSQFRIGATAIHADDKSQVFDRASLQQPHPMFGSDFRPTCDHRDQFGTVPCGGTED